MQIRSMIYVVYRKGTQYEKMVSAISTSSSHNSQHAHSTLPRMMTRNHVSISNKKRNSFIHLLSVIKNTHSASLLYFPTSLLLQQQAMTLFTLQDECSRAASPRASQAPIPESSVALCSRLSRERLCLFLRLRRRLRICRCRGRRWGGCLLRTLGRAVGLIGGLEGVRWGFQQRRQGKGDGGWGVVSTLGVSNCVGLSGVRHD